MGINKYFPDVGYTEEQPPENVVLHVHIYGTLLAMGLLAAAALYFVR